MKKAISVILVVVLVIGLAACTTKDEEWRTFLIEYEQWVNDYIALAKKYESNPSDTSILSDYTKMASQVSEWSKKAERIKEELEDSNALAEFTREYLRITAKLADAA